MEITGNEIIWGFFALIVVVFVFKWVGTNLLKTIKERSMING